MDTLRELVAGSVGGIGGIVAGQPADVIKTRQQNHSGRISLVDCVRATWRHEGVRGFYRGMLPPMAGAAGYNGFSFAGYNACQTIALGAFGPERSKGTGGVFLAGCGAGLFSTVATTPTELVKVQLQVQAHATAEGGAGGGAGGAGPKLNGSLACVRHLLATGGLSRLYSGWGVTALRDTPATGELFGGTRARRFVLASTLASTRARIQ